MTNFEEASAVYTALLAELEEANARAAESPDDTELAAAAQELYDRAQAAYADVLAGYDSGDEAEPTDAVSNQAPEVGVDDSDYDLGEFGTPATIAAPAFGEEAPAGVFILTRKPVATRFVPSETPIEELTPISRSLLPQRAVGTKSELSRERNIAGNLPEWSPMPPGEVLAVKRVGTKKP